MRETEADVARLDPWGRARLEVIVGGGYAGGTDSADAWLLLNKGHLQMMVPPRASTQELRSDFAGGSPAPEVAAAGRGVYLSEAQRVGPRAPRDAARRCPRCRDEREAAKDGKAGEEAPESEDPGGVR